MGVMNRVRLEALTMTKAWAGDDRACFQALSGDFALGGLGLVAI